MRVRICKVRILADAYGRMQRNSWMNTAVVHMLSKGEVLTQSISSAKSFFTNAGSHRCACSEPSSLVTTYFSALYSAPFPSYRLPDKIQFTRSGISGPQFGPSMPNMPMRCASSVSSSFSASGVDAQS